MSGSIRYIGGLIGFNSGGVVTGSYATGAVGGSVGIAEVGGLVGNNNSGTITNSHATGSVNGSDYVGGLVGINSGSMYHGSIGNSYATGDVTATTTVGGLVGSSNVLISNSYATGTVTGTTAVGGLVGYNQGTITGSYSLASVVGTSVVGGLVGNNTYGTVTCSFYNIDTVLINNGHHVTERGLYTQQYQDWWSSGRQFELDIANFTSTLPLVNGYYQISSVQGMKDMLGFARVASYKFRLASDIDLAGVSEYLVPSFLAAEFDGAGFTISNLNINQNFNGRVGLFGSLGNLSALSQVQLLNASIVGKLEVGGLVGYNEGTVSASAVAGSVSGTTSVGGLVGSNDGLITNSASTANVVGTENVGGLVGFNNSLGTISNSYAAGSVSGTQSIGGLVGFSSGALTNSYATGSVTGSLYLGGLVGFQSSSGTLNNSFYDIDNTLINNAHHVTEGGLYAVQYQDWFSHGQLLNIANYGNTLALVNGYYEISSVQSMQDMLGFVGNSAYKFRLAANVDLASQPGYFIPHFKASEFDGAGYSISNLNINQNFNRKIGFFGWLGSNSTVSRVQLLNASVVGGDWGVGGLVGSNDGIVKNSSVTGSVSGTDLNVGGLVGVNTGSIRWSNTQVNVSGLNELGGLVGYNEGLIGISYATGNVNGSNRVGGLVGYHRDGLITDSHATGRVDGISAVGGLVGYNAASVAYSHATGGVNGSQKVGGLIGENTSWGDISHSYASGSVVGITEVGGLIGYLEDAAIANSYATGSVTGNDKVGGLVGQNIHATISDTYSTGFVSGTTNVGGLVGLNSGTVSRSYWDTETSGQAASSAGTGLSTANMKLSASFVGWDFTNGWDISEGNSYPYAFASNVWTGAGSNASWSTPENWSLGHLPTAKERVLIPDLLGTDLIDFTGEHTVRSLISDEIFALTASGSRLTLSAGGTFNNTLNLAAGSRLTSNGALILSDHNIAIGGQIDLGANATLQIDGISYTLIRDVNELQAMSSSDNARYALANNIDATDTVNWNTGAGFAPRYLARNMVFNGLGHVIDGLVINMPSQTYVGLFAQTADGALLKNLGLTNLSVSGQYVVGGLVGEGIGSIINSYTTGDVSGLTGVGGLAGQYIGLIDGSYSGANVSGSIYVGGLAGGNGDVQITNSYFTGTVTGDTNIAAICPVCNTNNTSNTHYNIDSVRLNGKRWVDLNGLYSEQFQDWLSANKVLPGISHYFSQDVTGYWQIGTESNLKNLLPFATQAGNKFKVTADLDLVDMPQFYIPEFHGQEFNGGGKTISNLSLDYPTLSNVGFIGNLTDGSVVRDVRLADVNVVGHDYVGGLVGYTDLGSVFNSHVMSGNVRGASWAVGGLVGASYGVIFDSSSSATVSGAEAVGGLVGEVGGIIARSSSAGTVTGTGTYTGGLVGEHYGVIIDSNSSATVNGYQETGGLVGENWYGSVINSYSTGTVTGTEWATGGLVGWNYGSISNSYSTGAASGPDAVGGLVGYNDGSIQTSFSQGFVSISSELTNVGGLVGENLGTVAASYWDTVLSGQALSAGGIGLSTQAMQDQSSYVGWDFSGNWQSNTGATPSLRAQTLNLWLGTSGQNFNNSAYWQLSHVPGVGETALIPYATSANWDAGINIASSASMTRLASLQSVSLANDVTLTLADRLDVVNGGALTLGERSLLATSGLNIYGSDSFGKNLIGLGNGARIDLTGGDTAGVTIYGHGYQVIRNVSQLQAMASNVSGYYVFGGDFDAAATATWNADQAGGYLGFAPIRQFNGVLDGFGHVVNNLYINRPEETEVGLIGWMKPTGVVQNIGLVGGSVTGGDFNIGALVGYNEDGTVLNAFAMVDVRGLSAVGGLVGVSDTGGQIVRSYSTGEVSGDWELGGLVGDNRGTIDRSFAAGSVVLMPDASNTGSVFGGLVGSNSGTITRSYATGDVLVNKRNVGGLVGSNSGSIQDSYSTGNVAGTSSVGGLVGEGSGSIAASFSLGTVTGVEYVGAVLGQAWDFDPVNNVSINVSINNVFWNSEATALPAVGFGNYTFSNVTGKTLAELKQTATFANFDTVRWIVVDGQLPQLRGMPVLQVFEPTNMVTNTWTGAVDNFWLTAGNWSQGWVPTASEIVSIPDVNASASYFIELASGTALAKRITSAELFNITGGGLTVDGNATFNAGLNMLAGTSLLLNSGVLTVTIPGNGITLNGAITAPGVKLNGVGMLGNVSQSAAGVITATNLHITDAGAVGLLGQNDVRNLAASASTLIYNGIGNLSLVSHPDAINAAIRVAGDAMIRVKGDLIIKDLIATDGGAISLLAGWDGSSSQGLDAAATGRIYFQNVNPTIESAGGDISLKAAGSITSDEDYSLPHLYSSGGHIVLESRDGNVVLGSLNSFGESYAHDAGNVTVTATLGNINLGGIDAWGGMDDGEGGIRAGGGKGGIVSLTAGLDISLSEQINVSGGHGFNAGENGGNAGSISLLAGGNIYTANLSAEGGSGGSANNWDSDLGGQGGSGGLVFLRASGDIELNNVLSNGGFGGGSYWSSVSDIVPGGNGGHAGMVDIRSTGGSLSLYNIRARGGHAAGSDEGSGGIGGQGGAVTLEAVNVTVSSISTHGGSGGLSGSYFNSYIDDTAYYVGGRGGDGGAVTIRASGDIELNSGGISSYGGSGVSGGAGGNVTLTTVDGNIDMGGVINAYGGSAWAGGFDAIGSSVNGGDGGAGGHVSLSISAASDERSIYVGGVISTFGGRGGAGYVTNDEYVSAGGSGGAGGHVTLEIAAAAGASVFDGRQIYIADNIDAAGGGGALGTAYGVSGSGGNVSLSVADGSIRVDGQISTPAGEGDGSWYAGTGSAMASMRDGGDGGSVTLTVSGATTARSITTGFINTNGADGLDGGTWVYNPVTDNDDFVALAVGGRGGHGGDVSASLTAAAGADLGGSLIQLRGIAANGRSGGAGTQGGAGGHGGNVTVNATAGDILIGYDRNAAGGLSSIYSYGGYGGDSYSTGLTGGNGGNAGQIVLDAGGWVATENLIAQGGRGGAADAEDGAFAVGKNGGHGGTVTVRASGDVEITSVDVSGGAGGYSYSLDELGNLPGGNGGNAGMVDIRSTGGSISLGSIRAQGGAAAGDDGPGGIGGQGGTVTLEAVNVSVDLLSTRGGSGGASGSYFYNDETVYYAGGRGGDGGVVTVRASGDIDVGKDGLTSFGGSGISGGAGGNVTLATVDGNIDIGSEILAYGGSARSGGFDASGNPVDGGDGGAGGHLNLSISGASDDRRIGILGGVSTHGGRGGEGYAIRNGYDYEYLSAGGRGGAGGNVTLDITVAAGATVVEGRGINIPGNIDAVGGHGATGTAMGVGGSGGNVSLSVVDGSIEVGGSIRTSAGYFDGSWYDNTETVMASIRDGGDGGSVTLTVSGATTARSITTGFISTHGGEGLSGGTWVYNPVTGDNDFVAQAAGGRGGHGGHVSAYLTAATGANVGGSLIQLSEISARGGSGGYGTQGGAGGHGGNVTVNVADGDILIGYDRNADEGLSSIYTQGGSGGDSYSTGLTGGNGGNSGHIELAVLGNNTAERRISFSDLDAGASGSGQAGNITLRFSGSGNALIDTYGGYWNSGDTVAHSGRFLAETELGSLTVHHLPYYQSIWRELALGSRKENTFRAATDLTLNIDAVETDGKPVTLQAAAGDININPLNGSATFLTSTDGGSDWSSNHAGNLTLMAGLDINAGNINFNAVGSDGWGSEGDSAAQPHGGNGGMVSFNAGGNISIASVDVSGGRGQAYYEHNADWIDLGGNGGNAGSLQVNLSNTGSSSFMFADFTGLAGAAGDAGHIAGNNGFAKVTAAGNLTLPAYSEGGTSLQGDFTAIAAGSLTLSNTLVSRAGDMTLVAGGNFILGGGGLLANDEGRWLVYSTSPLADTLAGMTGNFKHYGQTYSAGVAYAGPGEGNGFLYSVAPSLAISLDPVSRAYNGSTSFALAQSNFQVSGQIAGDQVAIADLQAMFDSANAGTRTLTASGLSATASNGAMQVYGYGFNTTASNAMSQITQANLTVTANTLSKTYDGSLDAAGSVTVNGTLYSNASNNGVQDSLSGGTFAFTNANAGIANKTVTVGGVTVNDGNSGANYNLTYVNNTTSTINKADLTVTANSASTTYTGQSQSLTGFTASGLVNGETVSVLTGVSASGSGINAGSYDVIASGSASNYNLTFTNGTLNIGKANANVTANSGTTTYNGLSQSVSGFTASGLVNGETVSVLSGVSASGSGTNAGSYDVIASGSASNYNLTFTNGTLAIAKANATVTANSGTATYNGQSQSLTGFTASGLVNGETASVLSGVTATGSGTNAGTYNVVASGSDSNYNLTFNTGALTIDKANLTVTANAANKTYDGLTYSGGNGVAYSGFVSSETASVLGGNLSYGGTAQGAKNAGNYTLTASGQTSGNYNIAYVDNSLNIAKANATVTANSGTTTYNGQNQSLSGFTASGLVNGETVSVLSGISASGSGTNAGSYNVVASGSDSNYNLTFNTGALTIDKANLTVTANAASKTYDGLTYSGGNGVAYSGFVNNETASVLGGSLNYGGTAQGAKNAGNYTLTAIGQTSGNYNIAYVDNTLNIAKADASVTANSGTTTYTGQSQSVSGFTASGLVNGETVSVLGSVTASGGGTNAGSYDVVASGSDSNYNLTLNNGTLTIDKANATVTANSGTATYNGQSQSLSGFTATGLVNGETVSVLTGVTASGRGTNAGSYNVVASGTDSNYNLTLNNGTLNIGKANATITANSGNLTYNGLSQSVSGFSASGLVNGETISVLGGVTASGSGTNAGSYDVIASGSDSNYNLTFNTGALTIDKANLTVTANAANKTYDGLTYNGGNGVAYGGFVNNETASVLGGSLSYNGTAQGAKNAGNYTLTAAGQTSGNYNIAYVDNSLNITKANATVTANSGTATYNGQSQSLSGFTVSGLVNGETASVLSGVTASGSGTNAGSYGVIASGSDSNYNLTLNNGLLTIDKANLTVTTNAASKTYDGLTYSGGNGVAYGGFVNNETASVLGGSLNYGGTAQGAKNAGNYTLTAAGQTSGNYNIAYVDNSLNIAKADASVTANSGTTTYTGQSQGLTGFSASGLVNGETISVLSGVTATGSGTSAGTYNVVASGSDSNYNLTLNNGLLTIDKANLTVTANAANKTYDGLTYNGGNGVAYSGFVNSETASVLGGSLSYNGTAQGAKNAGNYTLTASGQTSGNYNIAYVDNSLNITKANATVTANSGTTTYTGQSQSVNGFTASGLVNGETVSVLSGVSATGSGTNAGTYNVVASGSDSNYNLTLNNGLLTIDKANLTVTTNAANKTYDGLTYNGGNGVAYSGFVNSETASTLGGNLSYGGTAQGAKNAGDYTLTAAGQTSGNYNIAYVDNTLNIAKANATVTANSGTATYNGQSQSVIGFTASGLVNGETVSVLSGVTASGSGTNAGNYDVIASGSDSNYNLTLTNGLLAIDKAAAIVTANSGNLTYNGQNQSISGFTASGLVNGETTSVLTGVSASGSGTNAGSYSVIASGGDSNYNLTFNTGALTIDKANATVTASSGNLTYTGQSQSLNGFTASGLVNGETVSVLSGVSASGSGTNAGNYNVIASGSDRNYNLTFNTGLLSIDKANLTVTANAASKTYDGLIYSGGNGIAYSGFVNNETASVLGGSLSYGGTAQGAKNAGNYTLTAAGQTSGNYNIAYVDNQLSIAKAHLTVTADNQSRLYGDANPLLSTKLSGFVNGETLLSAGVTGSASASTTATASTNVGATEAIIASSGSLAASNYDFTNLSHGTLSVTPRPITVKADAVTRVYGDANPQLTYVVAADGVDASRGLVGNDVLSGGLLTSAVKLSDVGSYPISQGSLGNANYAITFSPASGNVEVTARPLAVWTGAGGNSNWANAANWQGGVAPLASNVLNAVIPSGNGRIVYDQTRPTTLQSLTSGVGLSVNGGILNLGQVAGDVSTFANGQNVIVAGGTLGIAGRLVADQITVQSGTLNLSNAVLAVLNPLANAGTLNVLAGPLAINSGVINSGEFNVATGASLNLNDFAYSGSGNLSNAGQLTASAQTLHGFLTNTGVSDFTSMTLVNGFYNSGTINVLGNLQAAGVAATQAGGSINLNAGATLTKDSGKLFWSGGEFGGNGTLAFTNGGMFEFAGNGDRVINNPNLTFNFTDLTLPDGSLTVRNGTLGLAGTTTIPQLVTLSLSGGTLNNAGQLNVGGTFNLTGGNFIGGGGIAMLGGAMNRPAGSTVNWQSTGNLANTGTLNLDGGTITNAIDNQGTIVLGAGTVFTQTFTNTGQLEVGSGTTEFQGGYNQSSGLLKLAGGDVLGSVNINGGSLGGSGTINGDLIVASGNFAPGFSPGAITVNGNLTLLPTSVLSIELGGLAQGSGYDFINVLGTATLAGTLNVNAWDGYVAAPGTNYTFMNFTNSSGAFAAVNMPAGWSISLGGNPNSLQLSMANLIPLAVVTPLVSQLAITPLEALMQFMQKSGGSYFDPMRLTSNSVDIGFDKVIPNDMDTSLTELINAATRVEMDAREFDGLKQCN